MAPCHAFIASLKGMPGEAPHFVVPDIRLRGGGFDTPVVVACFATLAVAINVTLHAPALVRVADAPAAVIV